MEDNMKLSKKRWIFAVIVPILAIFLVVGGVAFAAYNFWQGQANVTVVEGMTVAKTGQNGGSWDGGTNTWTITSLKAGESKDITFTVTNTASSGVVKVTPIVTPATWAGFDLAWSGMLAGGYNLAAGLSESATLTITALGDIPVGSGYVFTITFERSTATP